MSKPLILLTGSSGNVGLETLKELVKRQDKYSIRVFDLPTLRNKITLSKFKNLGVEILWGDLRDAE